MNTKPKKATIFNTQKKNEQKSRIADTFSNNLFFHTPLIQQTLERISDQPKSELMLDWGCQTGAFSKAALLNNRASQAKCIDPAQKMVEIAQINGLDAERQDTETSLGSSTYDSIISLMGLHWVNNLPLQFTIFREGLKAEGSFIAALPGGGSLSRLRTALMHAETDILGGASPRLSPLPGLKDCGRLLQIAGFREIIVDRTEITLRYNTLMDGLRDLKILGEQAAFAYPAQTQLSRRILRSAEAFYREEYSEADGRLPAMIEVLWLTAKR